MKCLIIFPLLTIWLYMNAQYVGTASVTQGRAEKTMLRIPDTGQSKSFTNTWGEDSDYTIHPPVFLEYGPGIVTDTVTGLMWQRSDSGELIYENALKYADTLQLGGFSDWRLPTALEALCLMNMQQSNPALNPDYFPNTGAEYWWTSDKQVNSTTKIWVTNRGGGIGNHLKTETISAGGPKKFHARCVRDVYTPTMVETRFTDHGDGTITDNLTHLMWTKQTVSMITWEEALTQAENLSRAGYSDWRLPNVKELRSLNVESNSGPSTDASIFSNMSVGRHWSSTTLTNQPDKAWFWDNNFGVTSYESKTLKYNAIFVRNDQDINSSVSDSNQKNNIRIIPNPFQTSFEIQGLEDAFCIEIYDTFMHLIYKGTPKSMISEVNLTAGVYFLHIITGNHSRVVRRIIKW